MNGKTSLSATPHSPLAPQRVVPTGEWGVGSGPRSGTRSALQSLSALQLAGSGEWSGESSTFRSLSTRSLSTLHLTGERGSANSPMPLSTLRAAERPTLRLESGVDLGTLHSPVDWRVTGTLQSPAPQLSTSESAVVLWPRRSPIPTLRQSLSTPQFAERSRGGRHADERGAEQGNFGLTETPGSAPLTADGQSAIEVQGFTDSDIAEECRLGPLVVAPKRGSGHQPR